MKHAAARSMQQIAADILLQLWGKILMTKKIAFRAGLLCALFSAGSMAMPAAAANLLTNGGFEAPNIASAVYLGAGSTYITGWTVGLLPGTPVGTSIQFTDSAAFCGVGVCANEGAQFLDLTGSVGRGGGVISNGFSTQAGATYNVSFDVGAFTVLRQGNFGNAEVVLQINGATVGKFYNINNLVGAGSDWQRFSYSFTGTGNAMTVGLFASLDPKSSNLGVGLDDVRVELSALPPVPEPASWAMMIAGLGFAGAAMRRRGAGLRLA